VEQWELADMPNLDVMRANPDPFILGVTKTGEGDIVGSVVTEDIILENHASEPQ